jgi:hypothetical protein
MSTLGKPAAGLESLAGAFAAGFPVGLAAGALAAAFAGAAGALAAAGAAFANLKNGGCPLAMPKKDVALIHRVANALMGDFI